MARRTQSEWLALFQEFEQSSLTQVAFCAQHDINATYFSLRRTKLLAKQQSTAFVTAIPTQVSSSAMTTLHYGKVSLQIPTHNIQTIAQLVKALAE